MKKILILSSFLSLLGLFLFQGCYYDNEEELYPSIANPCDTSSVTYSKNVSAVINNYCVSCHGATYQSSGGGIKLNSYSDLLENLDAVISVINHQSGYDPMPKNSAKLSACTIRQIEIWKTNGAPNN